MGRHSGVGSFGKVLRMGGVGRLSGEGGWMDGLRRLDLMDCEGWVKWGVWDECGGWVKWGG